VAPDDNRGDKFASTKEALNFMQWRRSFGFSLMELMITVAVVGILASIAYPSYTSAVVRSHRTDARAELSRTAQALEKCFTQFSAYNNGGCTAATPFASSGTRNSADGRYQFSGTIAATTFSLTATAQGAQVSDTTCAALTLTETNVRGPAGCW
jgi:type IV pilus assembly protein PilE